MIMLQSFERIFSPNGALDLRAAGVPGTLQELRVRA